MVAAARLKSWTWPLAAAAAAGFIALLAFRGERPEPGLARFKPAGLLAEWPAAQVTALEVDDGIRRHSFRRDRGGTWHEAGDDAPVAADVARRIDTGIKLLRNSAPERTDLSADQLHEFGLQPPLVTVIAHNANGEIFTIEFGSANPLGLERYARVAGRSAILLMPAFVADAWGPTGAPR